MPSESVREGGVWCVAVRGCVLSMMSGLALAGAADASAGALRLSCLAPSWIDAARVEAVCRAVGDGMASHTGRAVQVVTGAADVALEVVKLADTHVVARLHWPGAAPGPEVELGVVDALLTEQSFHRLAAALLDASPLP